MARILWLLLYMISLPFELNGAPPLTEEVLQRYLNRQIKMPSGQAVTLQSLYGDQVNVDNFKPGEGMIQFLDTHPDEVIELGLTRFEEPLSVRRADVQFDYIERATERVAERDLVVIKGGPGSGKTRAMRIIELGLYGQSQPILAVYIDLPQVFHPDAPPVLNSADLLQRSIPTGGDQFVKNVAEVNPQRVKILMDNFDRISPAQRQAIINAITQLQAARVGVAVSSTVDIAPAFRQRQMNPAQVDLPLMTEMNFEKLGHHFFRRMHGDEAFRENPLSTRTYIKALRLMTFETPLPRSVGLVRRLFQLSERNGLRPVPTMSDYLELIDLYEDPKALLRLSDNMRFDKGAFYRELLPESSNFGSQPFYPEVYGVEALKMLLEPATHAELGIRRYFSEARIQEFGANTYKLMTFENGAPVDFLHPEYKRFFAAEYILNSFAANTPLTESFKAIMKDPSHSMVAEFINSGLPRLDRGNQIKTIFSEVIQTSPEIAYQIADNLIAHRFDNLCPKMLEALHQEHHLNDYINNHRTIIESKNKYSLGMLSEPMNVDNHYRIPRKTPWMYKGNRIEMIVNLKLTNSRATLQQSGYSVDPNVDLIAAAKEPQGLAEFLQTNRETIFTPKVLETAMYESIKRLGPESIGNMRLLRARGARPTAVNVEGRTLALEAARWHSRELLQAVHEEFGVSLYDSASGDGQRILFELLDHALPSNHYVQENAWESLAYLTEKVDLSGNEEFINKDLTRFRQYNPPLDIIDPPYLSLIARDELNPDSRFDAVDTLEHFIPIENVDLPREVLAVRRLLITKNCVEQMLTKPAIQASQPDSLTIAELVLSHNPIEGVSEFRHYKSTVKNLLTRKVRSFNTFQLERVSLIMAKSQHEAAHILEMMTMIRSDVALIEPLFPHNLKRAFDQRITRVYPESSIEAPFETRVIETVYDVQPEVRYANERDLLEVGRKITIAGGYGAFDSSSSDDDEPFCLY